MRLIVLSFVCVLSFSSCQKCVDCSQCPTGVTLDQTEFCDSDFDSNDDYNSAVALIEAFGCECS